MPKLNPVSQQELVKVLRRFGFEGPFAGGKHLFMIKGNLRLTIPNPHKEVIVLRFIESNSPSGRDITGRMDEGETLTSWGLSHFPPFSLGVIAVSQLRPKEKML